MYRRRLHRIFLKDYRQIRGQQRARMRRERRNGLAHISSAHWLPANFPQEPITLRTNQASLERHQVKLLRPIFSLSPRLPSRVSLKVRFTMAIHPLCGIRLALAVRRRLRNVESFLGSKRRLFARKNREFTEGERERESGERSRVTSVPTTSIRDQTVWQPFVTSGEQLRGEYSKFIVDYYQNS